MSGPDPLFPVKNNFYLGAYQAAINESNVGGLTDAAISERDVIVYRSYVALGSYEVGQIGLLGY
jgi:coatomer protein complex subunit epsilon